MKRRVDGVIRLTPAADYTNYEGYGVTISGDTATLSSSASAPIDGIITEGGTVALGVTVAVLGAAPGGYNVKLSGAVTRGDKLVQAADGTFVTDPGSGARVQVAVANETGVSGDLVEALLRTPLIKS